MVSFKIAKMRDTITIEYSDISTSETGSPVESWYTFATVRVWVESVSGTHQSYEDHLGHRITKKAHLRYIPGVETAMRVVHDDLVYQIVYVVPDDLNTQLEIGLVREI